MIKTCEFITPKHPDKICDFIADSILDAYMAGDSSSRVAIEVMGGHGLITVTGEVTSGTTVEIEPLVKKIVGEEYEVRVLVDKQSPFIAQGVDVGGAGDQGIMVGYACRDTETLMPLEYELARDLCKQIYEKYPYDGKVQVTLTPGDDGMPVVLTVVASFQHSKNDELEALVRNHIRAEEYLINPAGEWTHGGLDADSGLSGRKLVVDSYGPEVSIGGGSFSGKDYTKVDRSGAYMARKIAVDYLAKFDVHSVKVKLAYAIGKKDPVMAWAVLGDGREVPVEGYDLSPAGIKHTLGLEGVKFADTAVWGHFGRGFIWDK